MRRPSYCQRFCTKSRGSTCRGGSTVLPRAISRALGRPSTTASTYFWIEANPSRGRRPPGRTSNHGLRGVAGKGGAGARHDGFTGSLEIARLRAILPATTAAAAGVPQRVRRERADYSVGPSASRKRGPSMARVRESPPPSTSASTGEAGCACTRLLLPEFGRPGAGDA